MFNDDVDQMASFDGSTPVQEGINNGYLTPRGTEQDAVKSKLKLSFRRNLASAHHRTRSEMLNKDAPAESVISFQEEDEVQSRNEQDLFVPDAEISLKSARESTSVSPSINENQLNKRKFHKSTSKLSLRSRSVRSDKKF